MQQQNNATWMTAWASSISVGLVAVAAGGVGGAWSLGEYLHHVVAVAACNPSCCNFSTAT